MKRQLELVGWLAAGVVAAATVSITPSRPLLAQTTERPIPVASDGAWPTETRVAQAETPPPAGQTQQQQPQQNAEHPLARQVSQLMARGRTPEALKLTADQLKASPNDTAVRGVYLDLRMLVVRQALAAQQFTQAEALLGQVLAVEPKHATASKILEAIRDARGRVNAALADAAELLRIERFEQSAALLAQAAGLVPDRSADWKQPWLSAAVGAGDDHYMMSNYHAALPFYTQALALGGDQAAGADKELLWRWSHCYAMNLAASADIKRSAAMWQSIISESADRFRAGGANLLGQFVAAVGRENLGDYANAVQSYKQLLAGREPAIDPAATPQQTAAAYRKAAVEYVDSLNRWRQIGRRGGAWAAVLPGEPMTRASEGRPRVIVRAHNDLAARRVFEAITYHAPRLVAYLGGRNADLDWNVPFVVTIEPKFGQGPPNPLADKSIPSYTRITSRGGQLVRHQTVCYQDDPLLLGATIPHELTHALLSRLAGYPPVPLTIDEGLAIHAETTARYLMFRRTLLAAGGVKRPLADLLAVDRLPAAGDRAAFYAECYNLVAWLLTRGRPDKVVALCRLTTRLSPLDALLKTYEFADPATAEKAYRTFLLDQGLAGR